MKYAIAILVALAIAAVIGWRMINATYSGEPVWIMIPADTPRDSLRSMLEARLGDWGGRVFTIFDHAAPDDATAHGAYRVESGERAKDFARRLVRRRQDPVRVTVNNSRLLSDVASRIASQLEITPEQFLAACDSVLPEAGFTSSSQYIAAFLPDTYEFYWTAAPQTVVGRLLDYRNRFWSDERRAKALSLGLTPVQAATIASIAEEETNDRAERGTVSRLYLNRFRRGMPLQADPTVKFAVGDFTLRRILSKHLATRSPYNTYQVPGLPPGPIRLAEAATIDALLNSAPHDYIYMCARPDRSGLHNFTSSYSDHLRNAAAYRRTL